MPYENMPNEVENPMASLLRQTEPYHFERSYKQLNRSPRLAQPNTNQPNQRPPLLGWGMTTREYYAKLFQDYLRGQR